MKQAVKETPKTLVPADIKDYKEFMAKEEEIREALFVHMLETGTPHEHIADLVDVNHATIYNFVVKKKKPRFWILARIFRYVKTLK